ncbi:hypothetical protein R9C00_29630 (plasmid) [Flammeovirgaceae bacterium SG7u.111]|nr:hypothetical protein [Flammeovirgaceae bacterium SG7u.132]WPO38815.1 hypothetical protein R9C00_29630 [Flammeovirgaceae bacterium SG7u.111]
MNRLKLVLFFGFIISFQLSIAQEPAVPHSIIPLFSANTDSTNIPLISGLDGKGYFFRFFTNKKGTVVGRLPAKKNWFPVEWLDTYEQIDSLRFKLLKNSLGKNDRFQYLLSTEIIPTNVFKFEGIFVSQFENKTWKKPEKLSIKKLNYSKVHSFYMSSGLDVLIFSMTNKISVGKEDLFVSEFDGENWSTPLHLGVSINSVRREICPFLSEDKKQLFFSSENNNGTMDIFVAKKLYDSWKVWSKPEKLIGEINTDNDEFYFCIGDDNECFYISNFGNATDIYKASFSSKTTYSSSKSYNLIPSEEIKSLLESDINLSLNFQENSYELTDHSKEILWYIANKTIARKNIKLLLKGGKANSESDDYLPMGRAINATSYLSSLGFDRDRIITEYSDKKESKLYISFVRE